MRAKLDLLIQVIGEMQRIGEAFYGRKAAYEAALARLAATGMICERKPQ